jgi:hypothetical protein
MPMLRTAPDERAGQLARVPPELQELVKSRLTDWDGLPLSLRQEFLANDKTVSYFAQTPPPSSTDLEPQGIAEQFQQFLDLTPAEKQKLLGTLSETERAQMEQTLKTFEQLPVPRRTQCIRNYAKFAGMSTAERNEFLKNAESWSKMSPQERQTWRDLVAHVPRWSPMPPPIIPPVPPHFVPRGAKPSMATN